MGSAEGIHVSIFGVEYSIKGDVDEETTRQVAKYVHAKMTEIHENTASHDHLKIAVLSALNIAGELFELKKKEEEEGRILQEMKGKVNSLSGKIDDSLN
jgi:cell division protein ZapA